MKLVWTRLAIEDIGSAYDYIAAERFSSAVTVVERIEKALHMLARHPNMGRPGRVGGTRELVIPGTPFIVPYWIKGKRIEVLALIHGARRWPDSL